MLERRDIHKRQLCRKGTRTSTNVKAKHADLCSNWTEYKNKKPRISSNVRNRVALQTSRFVKITYYISFDVATSRLGKRLIQKRELQVKHGTNLAVKRTHVHCVKFVVSTKTEQSRILLNRNRWWEIVLKLVYGILQGWQIILINSQITNRLYIFPLYSNVIFHSITRSLDDNVLA